MEMTLESVIAELKARTEIPDLIYTYALGVTSNDPEMQASVFAPDAQLELSGKRLRGIDEISDFFRGSSSSFAALGLTERSSSTPLVGNIILKVEGSRAHSESTAIICHAGKRDVRSVTLIRGVRYSDDFVLLDDGWKIERRIHDAKWSTEVLADSIRKL